MSKVGQHIRHGGALAQAPSNAPGTISRWSKLRALEDRIFAERRLQICASGIIAAYAVGILVSWMINRGVWAVLPDGTLSNIDFCWIWVSGKFAASSDPSRIYDHSVYAASQDMFYRPGECLFMHQYIYPPTFLFFAYPLGFMPYLLAFAIWVIATMLLYQATVWMIIPRGAAVLAAMTPAAAVKNIQLGHTGFLVAALIGLSLVFAERRRWFAGIFLGLLTCKPQYGVLFPFALLASRNWPALGSATASAGVLGLAAALVFGSHGWPDFIDTLFDRNAGLSPDEQVVLSLQSVYTLLNWAGAGATIGWSMQAAAAVLVALGVAILWAKPISFALKAAFLCAGSVVVTPYVLAYDLCILSIAVAFLVSDGLSSRFLPGERAVILVCWGVLFFPAPPLAPFICAALILLVVRRVTGVPPGNAPRSVASDAAVVAG
ncbi:MAG TPA: glycosyltransferase family 87 protein [Stellaceae bacterium]|nr:glycosyltransferase family 87 protein [Stellaceae bacterium]